MEIPHFAALRGKERELVILRSETGESWKEHHCEHTQEELNQILNGMDEGQSPILADDTAASNDKGLMTSFLSHLLQNWKLPKSWRGNAFAVSSLEISHNTLLWCHASSKTVI